MMIEAAAGLTFLFSLWVFGRSLILAFSADDCDWLAMPIGLCLVGLTGNMLYFMSGLTVQSIQLLFLCALFLCLVIVFRKGISLDEWGRLMAVLGVFLLLALPAYIGGEQYYVFRGNHWDHFNYITQALAIWANPYPVYHHALADKFLGKDILVHGMALLDVRPAVGLVFALLLPDGRGNIHLLAFLYVTALWALVFPAACFSWKRILEAYKFNSGGLLLLIGPPFAYVVGFWGQYIFDINAWSQMASLSLLLAFVFEYVRLLQKSVDPSTHEGKSITSLYAVTGLLAAGAFLFYPENTVMHAGLLLAATVLWCAATRKVPRPTAVVSFAVFSTVLLLISSIPNWKGTIGLMIGQVKFGAVQSTDWWRFFDRYLLGIHGDVLFNQFKGTVHDHHDWWKFFGGLLQYFNSYWHSVHIPSVVGYMSTFANLILALTGMFFVTPDYAMPFWLRYGWIAFTVILAILAVYGLAASLFVRFRENQTTMFLKAFFLSGVLFLLCLLKKGALWSFGKALSYLSPYLFLVICLGLLETGKKMEVCIRGFVIIFIISQIAFGAARLWSSRDPNGIGYDSSTYPSINGTAMKTAYRWDWDPEPYAHCQDVHLYGDAGSFYMDYVKQKLTYLKVPYFSSLPVNDRTIVTDCNMAFIKKGDGWITVKE